MKIAIRGVLASIIICHALATTHGQTTAPVLNITKASDAYPAVVRWTSVSNYVYTILSSSNLNEWFPADTDFAAQGTNTIWTDYGSESAEQSRPSSFDPEAPQRFYRVQVQGFMSNATTMSVTITNIPNGAVLSGPTNVGASVSTSEAILANNLYIDGYLVRNQAVNLGDPLPVDTRFYPNGAHRLTVTFENDGDAGTTGGDDPVSDLGAGYGVTNITVTFSNFLSNFRVRYQAFRPDLGQTEEVYATWATPRSWKVKFSPFDNLSTEIRSFTGCGTKVLVQWNGLDSVGNQVDPQLLAVQIIDLGACTPMVPAGGNAMIAVSTKTRAKPTDYRSLVPPLPWDKNTWVTGPVESVVPKPLRSTANWDSAWSAQQSGASFGSYGPQPPGPDPAPTAIQPAFIKTVGTFVIGFQGHHPVLFPANRPLIGPGFGQATMLSSHSPPWGRLRAPYRIKRELDGRFPMMGYQGGAYGDDGLRATNMLPASAGGNHVFDSANLGLFIGHSAGEQQNIIALGHRQTYIPIYNQAEDTITWIGMNDMRWGSDKLKWMAFYSCNLFRDDPRSFPAYSVMKNNEHLAITTDLHIMQAYITESTIDPHFGAYWTESLSGHTANAANHTVVGAWNYVCRRTQPKFARDPDENIARSACWPECVNDFIYGYGSQTDPDPAHVQGELVERDAHANDPEP